MHGTEKGLTAHARDREEGSGRTPRESALGRPASTRMPRTDGAAGVPEAAPHEESMVSRPASPARPGAARAASTACSPDATSTTTTSRPVSPTRAGGVPSSSADSSASKADAALDAILVKPPARALAPLSDELRQLLERARLAQHSAGLQSLGAKIVADLDDITTGQLRQLGFLELEITRLRKEIAASRGDQPYQPRGSMLVKAYAMNPTPARSTLTPSSSGGSTSAGGDDLEDPLLPGQSGKTCLQKKMLLLHADAAAGGGGHGTHLDRGGRGVHLGEELHGEEGARRTVLAEGHRATHEGRNGVLHECSGRALVSV